MMLQSMHAMTDRRSPSGPCTRLRRGLPPLKFIPWPQGPAHFRLWLATAIGLFMLGHPLPACADDAAPADSTLTVHTAADSGEGSLRQAILRANALSGPHTIRFAAIGGPFDKTQTIRLRSPLPALTGELTIDGYIENSLWQAVGVTLSGANRHQVMRIAPGAKVTLRALTIADGHAQRGGGIVNQGELVVKGVTFSNNRAEQDGGGLANLGNTVAIINSTFVDNRASQSGGGLANNGGRITVTHGTFSANGAKVGGGLFSRGTLLLRNTLLANSREGSDCTAEGTFDPASSHNLIESNEGCGQPISTADPRLEPLGLYNGPTPTLPLGGGSPAINMGDNAAAVDEHGAPLVWDQRGNGDPRFVAGFADIGAFEVQAFPVLQVNTVEDSEMRACSGSGMADCSLRGAITLANAMGKPAVIGFDPKVFASPQTITPMSPLPEITVDLTLDAHVAGRVTLTGAFATLRTAADGRLTLHQLKMDGPS